MCPPSSAVQPHQLRPLLQVTQPTHDVNVRVYDADDMVLLGNMMNEDDFLGGVTIPLRALADGKEHTDWYISQPNCARVPLCVHMWTHLVCTLRLLREMQVLPLPE